MVTLKTTVSTDKFRRAVGEGRRGGLVAWPSDVVSSGRCFVNQEPEGASGFHLDELNRKRDLKTRPVGMTRWGWGVVGAGKLLGTCGGTVALRGAFLNRKQ